MDPGFNGFILAEGGLLATKTTRNTTLALFLMGNSTQSEEVIVGFAWQFLSTTSYFRVPMVLFTMSFWENPKYFPQL